MGWWNGLVNPLLVEVLPALQLEAADVVRHLDLAPGTALPSRLDVGSLAAGAVAAAGLAARAVRGGDRVQVDPRQVAIAVSNDRRQTIDGMPGQAFAPHSGFFEAADGWVRTHANYAHHRARLLARLGLSPEADVRALAAAIADRPAQQLEDEITAAGGIAVRVRAPAEWAAGDQARAVRGHDLLSVRAVTSHRPVPVRDRPRVLDLTRVLAGPVATRTLALVGCDVLRVDPPHLPEDDGTHLETDSGKRTTELDLRDPAARRRFEDLLGEADVLVTGYRPGALAAFGLDEATLARRYPPLIVATLSAWTPSGPWGARRGFDSIVQAATGIAVIESPDGVRPGALPAQVLDHATGYLIAAGVLTAIRRRAVAGGTWRVSAHLARTAAWLLARSPGEPEQDRIAPLALDDLAPYLVSTVTDHGTVVQSRPALRLDGRFDTFAWVGRRRGADDAAWAGAITGGDDGTPPRAARS